MDTPTERIRRELRSEVALFITRRKPKEFLEVTDISKLREMLDYAEKQFLKTWAPADAEFWKKRISGLKTDLKKRGVRI